MSFRDLFSQKRMPPQRVRICVECGMPIAEHREWCSILRTQRELDLKARGATQPPGLNAEEG